MRGDAVRTAGHALRAVAGVACVAAVTLALGLASWTVLPAVLGWTSTVVLTGSMTPGIRPGDVVVSAPVSPQDVVPGRVLLVRDPAGAGRLLLHRVTEVRTDGSVVTQGDANAVADAAPVPADDVVALPRLRVPAVGLPALWLRERRTADLALLAVATVGVVGTAAITVVPPADPRHGRRRAVPVAR